MPPTPAWEIYQQQLVKLGHGLPLWNPQPMPGNPIACGSVAYLSPATYSEIIPLFHAMQDGPQSSTPDGFEPLRLTAGTMYGPRETIQTPCLSSESVSSKVITLEGEAGSSVPATVSGGAGVSFKCKRDVGAFLILETPAVTTHIQSKRRIVTYMTKHFDSWMRLANEDMELGLAEDAIYFVSGTTMTRSWLVTAFQSNMYSGKEGYVSCDLGNLAGANISMSIEKGTVTSPEYKFGPSAGSSRNSVRPSITSSADVANEPDQCIFIHYYKMKKRFVWKRPIKAAAGPDVLPDQEDEDDEGSAVLSAEFAESDYAGREPHQFPASSVFDPVEPLLDYIFENSVAEIAIACDRDLAVIFRDHGIPDDIRAGLLAIGPPIDVDEAGVGTISVDVRISDSQEDAAGQTAMQEAAEDCSTPTPIRAQESEDVPIDGLEPSKGEPAEEPGDDDEPMAEAEAVVRREEKRAVWETNAHTSTVTAMAVSPDGKWVASGSDDATIILWDVHQRALARRWDAREDTVWALAFSPDSTTLASGGSEGELNLWAIPLGTHLAALQGHGHPVQAISWDAPGLRLASSADDGSVRVWDAVTRTSALVIEGHGALAAFVRFSPDGMLLASGGADYVTRVWDLGAGEQTPHAELRGHDGMVWAGEFDAAGARLVTASDDGSVRVWSAATGEALVNLHEHHGPVWGVAFGADGKEVLSASSDTTACVCDSFTGERLLVLEGHDSTVNAAATSPDGKYIATASWDSTVRLWRRSDGFMVRNFNEHDDKVTHVAFTADGRHLISGSDDGMVHIRLLGPDL